MISRVLAATILLMLAAAACWGDALGAGYPINPFGILFLFFAVVAWLKWQTIRDGFSAAKGESDLPIIRLAAKIIGGMETLRRGPARRSPSN
jgi:hypothetical protein